jgi:hypothetical protein
VRVVNVYRRIRARLAAEEVIGFDVLIAETAKAASMPPERVHAVVFEWIETRPLGYLRSCLFWGVSRVTPRRRNSLRWDWRQITSSRPAMSGYINLMLRVCSRSWPQPVRTARETLFIGDRVDRDGVAGQRAGVRTLIRSLKPIGAFQTSKTFHDPLFDPFTQ